MKRTAMSLRLRGIAAGLAMCLSSCGGGGGGGPAAPEPPEALLPAAPTPGSVLYGDATLLRPVRAGSTYRYRGTNKPSPNSYPLFYTNTVEQAADGAGLRETASNWFGQGVDSAPISTANGTVLSRQWVDLGGGAGPIAIDAIELRSPVRESDQYTILERRLEGALADVDLDSKPESIDIAAYRRVIGHETIQLRDNVSFTALRVDYVTRARVQLSKDQRLGPIAEVIQTTWYVPGIGVARQRFDVPNSTERQIYDEELLAWDGIDQGYGMMAPVAGVVPADGTPYAGQRVSISQPPVRTPTGVVVLGRTPGDGYTTGSALSLLDNRGQVLRTRVFAGWESGTQQALLAAVGSDIVALQLSNVGLGYQLASFDTNFEPRAGVQGVPIDLGPTHPDIGTVWVRAAVGEGDRLWVLFQRTRAESLGGGTELMLQAFDSLATPRTAAFRLDGGASGLVTFTFGSPKLSAASGRVVASWAGQRSGAFDQRYAVVASPDAAPVIGVLTDSANLSSTLVVDAAGPQATALWSGALDTRTSISGGDTALRGVSLGADGAPLRTSGGTVDAELLSSAWPSGSRTDGCTVSGGALRSVLRCGAYARAWPYDSFESVMLQLAIVEHGSAPLPERMGAARIRRIPPELAGPSWVPRYAVLFDDRLLIVGVNGDQIVPAVYWLR